jgi:DNA-binding CsgD family transcriptional regulator
VVALMLSRPVATHTGGMTATLTTASTELTPRERQVATLLAYGYTNGEIAGRLGISIRTAEMHRGNAMRKLGAGSRARVVRWALDNDLLR